jgi:hypothetical protein
MIGIEDGAEAGSVARWPVGMGDLGRLAEGRAQ